MKICTIIGARPQFVKAAVLSRALKANRPDIDEILVHTGQHYDANMSEIFFEQMNIPTPDYNLGVGGGTHAEMTGKQLIEIERVLIKEMPDLVLVYGDTNSTLAGALAAVKLHIPIAHVEAGLRSHNVHMPEEINRVLVDRISTLLFVPTASSKANLLKEGIDENNIHITGDIMCDASHFYAAKAEKPSWFEAVSIQHNRFILATLHRAENTDDPKRLQAILDGLNDAGIDVILPLHPRTRDKISQQDINVGHKLHIVEPVGYLEMVWLEKNCAAIATDSGGVQKEAYFHRKKCVTLRNETEWTELVNQNVNVLTGADRRRIARALEASLIVEDSLFDGAVYGSGDAATQILAVLKI